VSIQYLFLFQCNFHCIVVDDSQLEFAACRVTDLDLRSVRAHRLVFLHAFETVYVFAPQSLNLLQLNAFHVFHCLSAFWTLRLIFDTGLIIYLASFPVLLVDFVISGISALVLVWSHQISIHAIFNSAEVCRALEVIDSVGFRAWLRHDDTAMVHPVHSDVELPAVRPVPPTHNARSTVATLSRVSQNDDSPPSCQSSASTAVASDDLFRRTRLKIPLAIPGFQHATAAMPAPVKSADVYESSSSDTDISSRDSTDRELGTQISRLELAARRAATQLAARSSANASSSSSNENQSTSTIFSVLGPKSNQTAPASSSGSEILAIGSVSSNNEDTAGTYILSPRNPELRPFHPTRDLQIPIPGGEMQVDARHPKAFLLSHLGGTVAATTAASPAPGLVLRPRAPLPVAASQTTAIARPPTNSSGMQHDVGLSELRDTTISSFASQYQYVAYAVSIFFGLLFSSFLVWFVVTVSIRDYSCGSQLQLSSEVWRSAYPRIYFDDGIRQTSCGFSRVTRLDAPNMGISVLPSHLFASLPSLEFVDVSHNALSELPLSLGQRFARNLTVLLASENLISHVSPSMLFNNPSLTRFDLRGNSACDLNWSSLNLTMLPSNFALLSNCIEKLNLSNNSLGGLGVDPDVATAARVAQSVKPKLQIIGPARDRISEPSLAQSSAQDWCELGLDRCQSVAIGQDPNFWLKTLSGFNKLRVLDVSQNILMWDAANNVDLTNLISSLPIMLPSLEILNLTGNNITSFDFLPLSSMQSFPASSVLTMNPSMIAAATSAWTWPLKTLDLSNNLLTSLSCGVQYEPWLTKSTLVLRGNPISQFYCSSRPWDGPAISSVNIALLQNIPTLKIFGTQGRPITAQTLSSVFLASPGLRFLLLFSINLANLPSSLSTLSNLQLLSLRGNPLGNGIADLPFLPSLFVLSTSNTKFLSIPADISTRLPNLRRLTLVGHQLTSIPTALGAMFWQGFLHSVELTPGTTNNRFWSPLQPFDWSGLTTLLENSLGVPCHSSNEKVYCGYQCSPSSRPGVIYLGTPSQFNLPAPSTPVYPSTIVTPNEGTVTRLSVLQSFGLSTSDDPLLWFPASKIIDTNLSLTSGTIVKRYPAAMLEQLIYRPQLNRTASAMAASFASSSFRLSTPQGRASILFDDVPRSYVSFVPSGSGMFTDDGLPFNDRYPATVSSSLTWLPAATNFVDAVMPSNVLRQLFVGDEALRIHAGGALCEWKLIAPGSARIRLKLVELDLDRSPGPTATSTSYSTGLGRLCPRDFLQLFDGDSASSPSLLDRSDRICGSLGIEMPTSWTTSGSTAFVRFVSDLDDNDRGFAIAFSLVN
jgi:Leucine-rich repeat (LRR) protein